MSKFKVEIKPGHEEITYSGKDFLDLSGKGTVFNVKLKDLGKEFLEEWAKANPETCRKHLRIIGDIPKLKTDNAPGEKLPIIPASKRPKKEPVKTTEDDTASE